MAVRHITVVAVGIKRNAGAHGFQIGRAGYLVRPRLRLVQRRQEHGCENRDDRDHDYDHLLNIQYGVY